MWYWAMSNPVYLPPYYVYRHVIAYAESRDGITWTNKTIVHGTGSGTYYITGAPWVLKENGTYLMWHMDWYEWVGADWSRYIAFMRSPDGVNWPSFMSANDTKVLSAQGQSNPQGDGRSVSEPWVIHTPGQGYAMWYSVYDYPATGTVGPQKIWTTTSVDGVSWSNRQLSLPYVPGSWEGMVSHPSVVKEEDETYTMFYAAAYTDYSNPSIGVARSLDGISWTNRTQLLKPSDLSANITYISEPSYFQDVDGKRYLYFTYSDGQTKFGRVQLGPDWWPMFHHDLTHTGYSTSTAPNTNLTGAHYMTLSWVVSSPTVVDGVIYVGCGDNNVYALNATTGRKVWNYTTGNCVQWSSPAVVGGVVYVGSTDNNVYALNATMGTKVWDFTTGGAVWSSPAVAGGRVYVGSDDNKTYCLNASTGAHIWNYTTGGAVQSSPAVAGGMVFVGSWDMHVYALNATTGTPVWNYMTYGPVFPSPAVAGGVVYVSSLNGNIYAIGARWPVDVYWSNRAEPAPMGIADYGIGPSGPYEYSTKSFVGIVSIASLLTNRSGDNLVDFQLNVEFEFNTTCGLRVFWVQNVAVVRTFGSVLRLENFVENVWNWSEPAAIMDPACISGGGSFGTPQDPYGYVCTREGNFTPFNRTTPITITLNVTSAVSSSGEPTVSVAYDIGNGLVTYDMVTFTNVTVTSTPSFEVKGFEYAPNDAFYESALVMGGTWGLTTDVLSDVQLQLEYWNGHNYQTVPNAYNFGSNTAEKIDNVLSGLSHFSENGQIFAEILPGAGELGELYNQSQTGVINITSPLTLGTLYVTNASDPNATAWQIPFVSGEVAVTLYPGYYDLQLYNQYGELFDQGSFTVSAGQTLCLQATIPGDINGDQYVNAKDAVILGKAFGAKRGDPRYSPNADINDDEYVNAKDAVILGTYFGQHW
jgi:outer membrane protein assembly factor BamB